MDVIGPFISTALDTVTLSLPVLADMASELAGKLIQLAPFPYAGFVGDGLGYAIGLLFILFAVNLNISRKHFGSAFQISLEAIPFIGDILTEGAQKFELGSERYLINREKFIQGFQKVSPMVAAATRYYSPGFDAFQGPMPPISFETVSKNVKDYAMKASGLNSAIQAVQGATATLTSGIPTSQGLATAATTATAATAAATAAASSVLPSPVMTGIATTVAGAPTVVAPSGTAATAATATTAAVAPVATAATPKIGTSVGGTRKRKHRGSKRRTSRHR